MKKPWPQPPLETRKEVVSLIERGKHDEAVEILRMFYEIPHPVKVFTPRQILESKPQCLEAELPSWSIAFLFDEWETLKKAFPQDYGAFYEHYGPEGLGMIDAVQGIRIGWWLAELEGCPDMIIVSEKYFLHPAITIHEFSHILWHYVKAPPIPDTGPLSQPETWDVWTKDFLKGVLR